MNAKINVTLTMKMRLNKVLYPVLITILFMLACMESNISQPISTAALLETLPEADVMTPLPHLTPTPASFSTDLIVASTPPAWVTDFSDPILAVITDKRPDFQDDFLRNRGWFNVLSTYPRPLYVERQDGMLFLELAKKTESSFIFNTRINRKNFVLSLDLRFYHGQPDDTVRFQFDRSGDQSIAFALSNNRNWEFQWGSSDQVQSTFGIYEHFPPEHIPLIIMMMDTQCAIYLNNDPLTYSDDCRVSPTPQSRTWTVTIHLFGDSTQAVLVNLDNVKVWDLDKIPHLP